ncbi:MAG: hypothetical protein HYU67_08200 [Flavobacteriia bacterium]|nr:hypothetical protein [Flavobacteriia bacterium]
MIFPKLWSNEKNKYNYKESYPSYTIISDIEDKSIESGFYVVEGKIILISTGKTIKNVKIKAHNQKEHVSKTGYFELKIPVSTPYIAFKHKSIEEAYYENHSPKEKRRIKVIINASNYSDEIKISVEKPVIYVYNSDPINFSLQLKTKGELTFSYPKLSDTNTWNMKTGKNGILISENGSEYPYLFWEAKQDFTSIETNSYNSNEIVSGKNLVPYFEKELTKLGFNSKEIADFITYWCPKFINAQNVQIQFFIDDNCSLIGELNIIPKPDNLRRVFVLFQANPKIISGFTKKTLNEKVLDRTGFTVLEWGGSEVKSNLGL